MTDPRARLIEVATQAINAFLQTPEGSDLCGPLSYAEASANEAGTPGLYVETIHGTVDFDVTII